MKDEDIGLTDVSYWCRFDIKKKFYFGDKTIKTNDEFEHVRQSVHSEMLDEIHFMTRKMYEKMFDTKVYHIGEENE